MLLLSRARVASKVGPLTAQPAGAQPTVLLAKSAWRVNSKSQTSQSSTSVHRAREVGAHLICKTAQCAQRVMLGYMQKERATQSAKNVLLGTH